MWDIIKDDVSEDYSQAVKMMVTHLRGAETEGAENLYKAMHKPDNGREFLKLLLKYSEGDMASIKKAYKKKYGSELEENVRQSFKEPLVKILLEILNKTPQGGAKSKQQGKKVNGMVISQPAKRKALNNKPKASQQASTIDNNPLAGPKKQGAHGKKKEDHGDKKKTSADATVKPAKNFDPNDDCTKLHDAMQGLGTDEDVIIDILGSRNNDQRQQLKKKYQEKYKQNLVERLNDELSGDVGELVDALMNKPIDYEAYSLYDAMKGAGTDEDALIGIICSRSGQQLQEIKKAYKRLYKTDLVADVDSDTSGEFRELLRELLKGGRDQGNAVDMYQAEDDAKQMHEDGEKKDNKTFKQVLTKRNAAQIRATFDEYKQIADTDIYTDIKKFMSGDAEDAYLALCKALDDKTEFYADRIHKAVDGMGTDEKMLIRTVVTRCESDLAAIDKKYKQKYKKTIRQAIEDDTSGDFKKLLLKLV